MSSSQCPGTVVIPSLGAGSIAAVSKTTQPDLAWRFAASKIPGTRSFARINAAISRVIRSPTLVIVSADRLQHWNASFEHCHSDGLRIAWQISSSSFRHGDEPHSPSRPRTSGETRVDKSANIGQKITRAVDDPLLSLSHVGAVSA
jgi:hypothetical protein